MKPLSVRTFPPPMPATFGKWMWCKWCGEKIPEVIDGRRSTQRLWHPDCADVYNLHTNPARQREFLIARDGEKCAGCGCRPFRWLAGQVTNLVANRWMTGSDLWERPAKRWVDMTTEERSTGAYQSIDRVLALEVDHRTPLWSVADLPDEERRRYFGPRNIWLLCPTCHAAKTKREAAERAERRRFDRAQLNLI